MIIEISHFLTLLATGLFFLVGCFAFIRSGDVLISRLISRTYSHGFLFLFSSFLIYVWLAVTDNFSVAYIANHSTSLGNIMCSLSNTLLARSAAVSSK